MSAPAIKRELVFASDNIQLGSGAAKALWTFLVGAGAVLTIIALATVLLADAPMASTALHALHAGFIAAIALPFGALALVMILHLLKAGWTATIRRQFENLMSCMWVGGLMFLVIFVAQAVAVNIHPITDKAEGVYSPFLWNWMDPVYRAGDPLYEHKQGFLNLPFFVIRNILYFTIFLGLAGILSSLSKRQDEDANRWHTVTMLKVSAPGIVLFAFAIAFAGFDWVMTLDFHWFSTMFGVYTFAISMSAALALVTLTFILLRTFGRLHGAFTTEHLHDSSKLVFAFIVFWAYIAFSQYFLIWYANIPEETMFFQVRKDGPWEFWSYFVPIAKFIVPFIILLPRPWRRNFLISGAVCAWVLIMTLVEMYWMIRPEVKGMVGPQWVDLPAVLGPFLIMLGAFVRKVASGPLIPLNDPRTPEALRHKNYV
ncbi:MAG: hypothetical protein ACTS3F_12045 [Phycisphaerales bacterium]